MTTADQLAKSCSDELSTLMWFGNTFLWIALITAVLVTIVSVVERLVALKKPAVENEAGGGAVSTLLDSIKGLVVALGQAPAWFAIFLAAILLLWAAPTFFGAKCVLVPTPPARGTPPTTGHASAPTAPATFNEK